MIYTLIFYILLLIFSTSKNTKSLKWCCFVIALYYGLRYDYMPDYMAYYTTFNRIADPNYVYDASFEHVEYGWVYLNKIFAPFGYFTFVFVCSCFFAFGVYKMVKCLKLNNKMLPIVIVGYFSQPTTAVLSSAQRQFVVTGILLYAFSTFIYGKIGGIKSFFSKNAALYFILILLSISLHTSAFVLLLLPLLYIVTSHKTFYVFFLTIFIILFLLLGETYLPFLFNSFIEETGQYTYLLDETITDGSDLTLLSMVSYAFFLFFSISTLNNKLITKNELVIVSIGIVELVLSLTAPYLFQVYRIAFYINLFFFLSIPIIYHYQPTRLKNIYLSGMIIWIIWTALKTLHPVVLESGRDVSYKLIFEPLFSGVL